MTGRVASVQSRLVGPPSASCCHSNWRARSTRRQDSCSRSSPETGRRSTRNDGGFQAKDPAQACADRPRAVGTARTGRPGHPSFHQPDPRRARDGGPRSPRMAQHLGRNARGAGLAVHLCLPKTLSPTRDFDHRGRRMGFSGRTMLTWRISFASLESHQAKKGNPPRVRNLRRWYKPKGQGLEDLDRTNCSDNVPRRAIEITEGITRHWRLRKLTCRRKPIYSDSAQGKATK